MFDELTGYTLAQGAAPSDGTPGYAYAGITKIGIVFGPGPGQRPIATDGCGSVWVRGDKGWTPVEGQCSGCGAAPCHCARDRWEPDGSNPDGEWSDFEPI